MHVPVLLFASFFYASFGRTYCCCAVCFGTGCTTGGGWVNLTALNLPEESCKTSFCQTQFPSIYSITAYTNVCLPNKSPCFQSSSQVNGAIPLIDDDDDPFFLSSLDIECPRRSANNTCAGVVDCNARPSASTTLQTLSLAVVVALATVACWM